MPSQQRFEDIPPVSKEKCTGYLDEGFQASDCRPFVFQKLIETTGLAGPDQAELQRELMEWTQKTM
jgi:hypothetical protein